MQNNNLTNKTLHKFYNGRDYSLFGVIGNPVSHSKSPDLHKNFLFNAGLGTKAEYIKINITNPAELKNIILTMPKMGFVGCNITTPFKEQVFDIILKLESEWIAKCHFSAKTTSAVNCLFFNPDTGIIEAYNTDASAFTQDLQDKKFTFTTVKALVIGAGGVSRAIIAGLLNLNIKNLHISIMNRTYEKAKNIEHHFKQYQFYKPSIKAMQSDELQIQDYNLIINTTSLGLKAGEYPDIEYNKINKSAFDYDKSAFCYDVIYPSDSPHSLTPFLQKCLDVGVGRDKLCNGYGMLFNQALASFKIWTTDSELSLKHDFS